MYMAPSSLRSQPPRGAHPLGRPGGMHGPQLTAFAAPEGRASLGATWRDASLPLTI